MGRYKYQHVGHGTVKNIHGVRISQREQVRVKETYKKLMDRRRYIEKRYEEMGDPSFEKWARPMIPKPMKPVKYSDLDKFRTRAEFEAYMGRVDKHMRVGYGGHLRQESIRIKNNIIDAINNAFDVDLYPELQQKVQQLIDVLHSLDDRQFKEMLAKDNRIWRIEFIYYDPQHASERLDELYISAYTALNS